MKRSLSFYEFYQYFRLIVNFLFIFAVEQSNRIIITDKDLALKDLKNINKEVIQILLKQVYSPKDARYWVLLKLIRIFSHFHNSEYYKLGFKIEVFYFSAIVLRLFISANMCNWFLYLAIPLIGTYFIFNYPFKVS